MLYGLLLFFILLLGLLVKIPFLASPLLGHFGSYQIVNAMMAQMMTENPLRYVLAPRLWILVAGEPALHLIYYPFGSLFAAIAHLGFGGSIDFWGRLQAAVFSGGSGYLLYRIAAQFFKKEIAVLAAFMMTFSPMVMVSGISFQNEAAAVFFLLLSFHLLLNGASGRVLVSGILFSLSLMARIHFLTMAPVFLYALLMREKNAGKAALFLLGLILPASSWFAYTYAVGCHNDHVLTSLFLQAGDGRLGDWRWFQQGSFYRRFFEIIVIHWLNPLFFPFFMLGLFVWKKQNSPFVFWALATLGTACILPQKVTDHPFYLIAGIPAASILAAHILQPLLARMGKPFIGIFLAVAALFSMRFYLPPAVSAWKTDPYVLQVGQEVQRLTKSGDLIVAQHGSAPDLLYYSRRKGWPFNLDISKNRHRLGFQKRLEAQGYDNPVALLEYYRSQGAKYLVISELAGLESHPDIASYIRRHYAQENSSADHFLLFDLSRKVS